MDDMMKLYAANGMAFGGDFKPQSTLVVNMANPLIKRLDTEESDSDALIAKQLYGLAVLSQRRFTEDELKQFLASSYETLGKL